MKINLYHLLLIAATAWVVVACDHSGKGAVKTDGQLSDSTTQQIEKIAETDTTQAFQMLDSLYEMGELAEHTYYYTRAQVYQGPRDRLLAIENVQRAYETPYIQQNDTIAD